MRGEGGKKVEDSRWLRPEEDVSRVAVRDGRGGAESHARVNYE